MKNEVQPGFSPKPVRINDRTTTYETLNRDVIEAAMHKSPVFGFAQNFGWFWAGNTLTIVHEDTKNYIDQNNHASLISLGALVESVKIAALFQNWQTKITVDTETLGGRIVFSKVDPKLHRDDPEKLLNCMQRKSYNGIMQPRESGRDASASEFSLGGETRVAFAREIKVDFRAFILKSEAYLSTQSKARAFLKNTFNDSVKKVLTPPELRISTLELILFRLFENMPRLANVKWLNPTVKWLMKKSSKRRFENSNYMLLTLNSISEENLLRTGANILNRWIELESKGFSVDACDITSLKLIDAETKSLPNDTLEKFVDLFSLDGPQAIRKQFALSQNEKPVWLFRFGNKYIDYDDEISAHFVQMFFNR